MDKVRLAKLLGMATSANDNEALVALRMANKMVVDAKLTWESVLAGGSTLNITVQPRQQQPGVYQSDDDWQAPHLRDKVIIETMFRSIYSVPVDDQFRAFIDSIHQWWKDKGFLTPGQYGALRKTYSRVKRA